MSAPGARCSPRSAQAVCLTCTSVVGPQSRCVAADLSPLFLLRRERRNERGEARSSYEFRRAAGHREPRRSLQRKLRRSRTSGQGLHLVRRRDRTGRFAAGAFDTVVTPWLIDDSRRGSRGLRPPDRRVAAASASLGEPSARCVRRSQRSCARRCSLEEVLDVVAARADLTVDLSATDTVRYDLTGARPRAATAKTRNVVTFAAVKRAGARVGRDRRPSQVADSAASNWTCRMPPLPGVRQARQLRAARAASVPASHRWSAADRSATSPRCWWAADDGRPRRSRRCGLPAALHEEAQRR
jgi:hypothetical protein